MLFNTFEFAVFFVTILTGYYLLPHRGQNLLLLVGSYIFYGWWDWRFLSLIFLSTVVDFACGLAMDRATSQSRRKACVVFSAVFNLSLLGVFKYFDFFSDAFAGLLNQLGMTAQPWLLDIVLPVGISFYTFQTMSYTIDIYRQQLRPTRNFLDFALFVSFFPQLVAGPIERAKDLLPQICAKRRPSPDQIYTGCYLILWGLFKKAVVADNLARLVDAGFGDPESLNLFSALLTVYAFAWQIYCDFSGYTDIARGCAGCLGIRLGLNFNLPYFSSNPSQFWKRWHISLSSWLRDYLYIPLGGSRGGRWRTARNLMITMILGGLWHGAGWTFLLWGAYHGLLLVIYRAWGARLGQWFGPTAWAKAISTAVFFHLLCVGWVFFRAQTLGDCAAIAAALVRPPQFTGYGAHVLLLILPLLIVQACQRWKEDLLVLFRLPWFARGVAYAGIYFLLFSVGKWSGETFIYFQF